jgi:hypothetical protein
MALDLAISRRKRSAWTPSRGAGIAGTRDESSSICDFSPADGIKAANCGNGGFGTPPFFEQLSDKPLLVREV